MYDKLLRMYYFYYICSEFKYILLLIITNNLKTDTNETLSTQTLPMSPTLPAPSVTLVRLRKEALRHRCVAMLGGRVAREAERGAAHRRTLLQRCRPAHQFGKRRRAVADRTDKQVRGRGRRPAHRGTWSGEHIAGDRPRLRKGHTGDYLRPTHTIGQVHSIYRS